jgi:glucosylceramidase
MLPMMREAIEKSKRDINILASPWSPPAWMKKTNKGKKEMDGSAEPNGLSDDPRIHAAWANYISKFITAYGNKGVPIWAITPQNEPEFAAPWEACAYNSTHQRDWIQDYLGPVIKQNHPNVLILAFDHNKDHLYKWAQTVMNKSPDNNDDDDDDDDNNGSKRKLRRTDALQKKNYVDGMAFHWYAGGGDRLMDGTYGYDALNKTYHLAPNKVLLATEGCSCPGVKIDSWLRAERHGHDIIFDLMN